jgi:membrane-associated phospholipid phosphatase
MTVGTEQQCGHAATAGPADWRSEFAGRVRRGFVRTVLSTSALTGLFFVGYFFVQRHPAYTPLVMPRTWLDLVIPFQPAALVAYASLWVYIGAGPGLQRSRSDFIVYGLWLCALCLGALGIFFFWPTQVPAPLPTADGFPGMALLHSVDETGNACPSLHVAAAVFTVVRVQDVLRSIRAPRSLRLLNLAWCLAIVYSTLAIRQHVVLDVVGGGVLGLPFALMSLRWRPVVAREAALAPALRTG